MNKKNTSSSRRVASRGCAAAVATVAAVAVYAAVLVVVVGTVIAGRGITLYRTIRFEERLQCIGPSEFKGPLESSNVIPN